MKDSIIAKPDSSGASPGMTMWEGRQSRPRASDRPRHAASASIAGSNPYPSASATAW
jgi:hypothetical protein